MLVAADYPCWLERDGEQAEQMFQVNSDKKERITNAWKTSVVYKVKT